MIPRILRATNFEDGWQLAYDFQPRDEYLVPPILKGLFVFAKNMEVGIKNIMCMRVHINRYKYCTTRDVVSNMLIELTASHITYNIL